MLLRCHSEALHACFRAVILRSAFAEESLFSFHGLPPQPNKTD